MTHHRTTCPTCGKAAATPYRREVRGEIVEGCIDEYHSDAMLDRLDASAEWHWRPVAIRFRARVRTELDSILGHYAGAAS